MTRQPTGVALAFLMYFTSGVHAATSLVREPAQCIVPASTKSIHVVFTPAYGSNPWPLSLITDKNSSGIQAIAHGEHGVVSGFTRPVADIRGAHLSPTVRVEWNVSPQVPGRTRCAYVLTVYIQHSALEIYVASEYAANSCEFVETHRHEMLHYGDLSVILRASQQRIRTALKHVGFPTSRAPWRLPVDDPPDASIADAKARLAAMVQRAVQPVADEIDKEAERQGQHRDEPARLDAVFRSCHRWFATPATRLAGAPSK